MGRPRNTALRRAEIVAALLRLMPQRGYAGSSITAIAAEAGLASGLVHYHFKNKHEILVAAAEGLGEGLRARFHARVSRDALPRDAVHAWVDAHLALGDDEDLGAAAAWATVGAEAQRDPDVRAVYEEFIRDDMARLDGLLRPLVRDDERRASTTRALVGLVEGLFRVGAGAPGVLPPGGSAPTARFVLDRILAGEESSPGTVDPR